MYGNMILSERVELRLDEDILGAIDQWRGKQDDYPSRSEAIRQLINRGLLQGSEQLQFSAGERMAVLMLCDVLEALPRKSRSEFEPDEVREIVGNGHLWALKSQYSWAFNREEDDPTLVTEVEDILRMWEDIDASLATLKPAEKDRLLKQAKVTGDPPRYEGFDGNNDAHYGVAHFLIKRLERFDGFRSDLNSHSRGTLPMYRRMLAVYKTIEPTGRHLSAEQLVDIFKARIHPTRRTE
jgi:uncharacterized protein